MTEGFTIVTYVNPSTLGQTPQRENASTPPILEFLKGHPKALGTVQIMIGVMTILCGIVLAFNQYPPIGVISGIVYWGPLISIITGSLSVAAEPKVHPCLVKGSLGMNVVNAIYSGTAIIILSVDCIIQLMCTDCYWQGSVVTSGISGVLAVLSFLQFSISISLSAFACKATCCSEPTTAI
ncbi:membrane-spanning 4-domains subfamily A member 4A-like [Clarias gariepinus]|uniref:membrane-spanning 4-domains subfamily A member 4A-like n=1 Tax=Clarias gariepinus TaxID=13013 RepID=UPI00234DD2FF|nr:membrane-spanning 4-domains subfamily A member 4A-like [Clarias gariepinus]